MMILSIIGYCLLTGAYMLYQLWDHPLLPKWTVIAAPFIVPIGLLALMVEKLETLRTGKESTPADKDAHLQTAQVLIFAIGMGVLMIYAEIGMTHEPAMICEPMTKVLNNH